MYRIVDEFHADRFAILQLDRAITERSYNKYMIEGREYKAVPIYDLPLHVAIESKESFIGKELEVIQR